MGKKNEDGNREKKYFLSRFSFLVLSSLPAPGRETGAKRKKKKTAESASFLSIIPRSLSLAFLLLFTFPSTPLAQDLQ
jgi:hypothetical protein